MILKNFIIALSLFSLIVISCSSSESCSEEPTKKLSSKSVRELALSKYVENFSLFNNSSKEYILVTSSPESNVPNFEIINYFVFDKQKDSIVVEDVVRNSTIAWHSEFEIEIIKIPGMIQKDTIQRNGYIINVKTQIKTKIDGGVR